MPICAPPWCWGSVGLRDRVPPRAGDAASSYPLKPHYWVSKFFGQMFGSSALNDRTGSQVGITHLVYDWSHLIPVSGRAGFALFIVLAVVASGVHSIVPVVRLLSRRLLDRASSSSELSGTRGLKRRAYSFLWLSVVRFRWGARLGTILSKVRVCSTGWLLVCATFCSTRCASWVVGLRSVRARRLSVHVLFG